MRSATASNFASNARALECQRVGSSSARFGTEHGLQHVRAKRRCCVMQPSSATASCRGALRSVFHRPQRNSQFADPQPRVLSWRLRAEHTAAGVSHGGSHHSYGMGFQGTGPVLHHSSFGSQAPARTVLPNTSLKLSANGGPPGRRCSAGVHFLQRRPGSPPLSPA